MRSYKRRKNMHTLFSKRLRITITDTDTDTDLNDDLDGGVFNFTRHAHLPIFTKLPFNFFPDNGTDDDGASFDDGAGDGAEVEARQLPVSIAGLGSGKLPVSSALLNHLVSEQTVPSQLGVVTPVENGTVALPLPKNFSPLS